MHTALADANKKMDTDRRATDFSRRLITNGTQGFQQNFKFTDGEFEMKLKKFNADLMESMQKAQTEYNKLPRHQAAEEETDTTKERYQPRQRREN